MRAAVLDYLGDAIFVRGRNKPKTAEFGLHSSQVMQTFLEKLLNYFFGPLVRSRKGKISLLTVSDILSKLLFMCPARKLSSDAVLIIYPNMLSNTLRLSLNQIVLQSLSFMEITHHYIAMLFLKSLRQSDSTAICKKTLPSTTNLSICTQVVSLGIRVR
jgi:hypothetical protein